MKLAAILLTCLPMLSRANLITRQDSPPVCFNACLLSAVSESENCEIYDTACICDDAATISSWVNCLYFTCSDAEFPLAIDAGDALCKPYESTKPIMTALPVSAPPDVTPHVEIKIKALAVPAKRQSAADPPTCFYACLMPSVMTSGKCQSFDTACICRDAPTLALTVNCLSQACSSSEFPLAVAAGDSLCAPYDVAIGPSVSTTIGAVKGSSLVMAPPSTMPLIVDNGTSSVQGSTSLTSAMSMNTDASQTTASQSIFPLTSTATFSVPSVTRAVSTRVSTSAGIPPPSPSAISHASFGKARSSWVTLSSAIVIGCVILAA